MAFKKGHISWNKGEHTGIHPNSEFKKGNKLGFGQHTSTEFKKGHINWNKGLPKEQQPHFGKHHTKETRKKMSENNGMRGKHLSEERKQKIKQQRAIRIIPLRDTSIELKVQFSSMTDEWRTPASLYERLNKEFHFDFDPCPIDAKFDGLQVNWGAVNFVNPPYSQIAKWIEKAYREFKKGKVVVLLIPSRTDTRWWHDYVMRGGGNSVYQRQAKIRGCEELSSIPQCNSGV